MNKNFKIFQVHGLTGLLVLAFVATGIFCGFFIFPIWVVMISWNEIVNNMFHGPAINYYQASLLWLFVVLCFYLMLRKSISIKVHTTDKSDDAEIDEIIDELNKKEIEEDKED